jgi:copper(I)-binding protein
MSKIKPVVLLISVLSLPSAGALAAEPVGPVDNSVPIASVEEPGVFTVEHPWIHLGADDALSLEADAKLVNHTENPVHIIGISSRGFRMGIIERVIVQDGIPRNAMVSSLTVRTGQTVNMNPKNYHFMLLGPRRKYKEGDRVKVKLEFQDRDPAILVFTVSAKPPAATSKGKKKRKR